MNSAPLKFGDFELDGGSYQLTRAGCPVKLERIPMELLMLLVERPGQLVTRGEIMERLWGTDVFLDVENSINTAIRKVRTALGDDHEHPAFIQTLTGRGYRFVAPLTASPVTKGISDPSSLVPEPRVMLAVLPFVNLSSDPEQEYFSDGLTEETIANLGRMNPVRLGVIARTSTMAYKRTAKSITQIGRELAVDYVLESSVRREGRRVRITSQLILVKDQTHLWADTYDRDGPSFLSVQDELGRAIARQVQIKLDPGAMPVEGGQTQDLDAYDLCLRGRHCENQIDHWRAIEYFQQAIAKDPNYALAFAGLAQSCSMLPLGSDAPVLDVLPKARAAANRAVELDERLVEAHAGVGIVKFWLEWDWVGAESAFRRAIELNSSDVLGRMHWGHLLSNLGRHQEAAAEIEQALAVDPLSPLVHAFAGIFMYHARDYDGALKELRNTLAITPHMWLIHLFLGKVYERKGRLNEAMDAFQNAIRLSGEMTEQISLKGYVYAAMGNRAEAERIIQVLMELSMRKYVPAYNIAMVHVGLGEVESALELLEKAYEARDVLLTFLAVEPKWDCVRGHPRFQDLLWRLALPPEVVLWKSPIPHSSTG